MKFYDRTRELETLSQIRLQSTENACFTVMVGKRRIGKTALLLKSVEGQKMVYLFVSRNSEAVLCQQFQKQILDSLGVQIYGSISQFNQLFEQLLIISQSEHYTLIIDEFQDLEMVNRAIFSEIQNLWDQYKEKIKLNFIVCGSIYSMMTKIFEHNKEPLFGRLTSKIKLEPFKIQVVKNILKDYNPTFSPEDLLFLYTVTGGVSHYIALLMNAKAFTFKKILDFITRSDSPFLNEGKDILVSEFGREYGIYFSILQLIAIGKTRQNEIDSIIGKNTGTYLMNLEKHYSLIVKNKPLFSKPESRNSKWSIDDNFLRFWFRFIYPNQMLVEMGKYDLLKETILNQYEQYSGLILEKYFRQKYVEEENITMMGQFWNSKGENEIDLIAINDFDKTVIIAEIKRNSNKINIQELIEKGEILKKDLSQYNFTYKALSLKDM